MEAISTVPTLAGEATFRAPEDLKIMGQTGPGDLDPTTATLADQTWVVQALTWVVPTPIWEATSWEDPVLTTWVDLARITWAARGPA